MLKNNRARGFDLKYTGPFQIIQTMGEDFRIRCQSTGKEKIVHYNRLKYFTPGTVELGGETVNELLRWIRNQTKKLNLCTDQKNMCSSHELSN